MITFRVSTEVHDNREVLLKLPPDVPIGKADLMITVAPQKPAAARRSRTSLAAWAEEQAEHWGSQLNSEDVETFTGRRF